MLRSAWFEQYPHPLVIAHRGASKYAPENTMAAFLIAVEQGAHAIELDVMLCASGHLVVIHDADVDRTTTGSGRVVNMSLKEIKALCAGDWFDKSYSGEPVPTLNEVLETVGRKCLINIELKNYTTPFDQLATITAETVLRQNLQHRVFFSSYNPFNFRKIKRVLPEAQVGLLTYKKTSGPVFRQIARWIGPYETLNPHFSDVGTASVMRTQWGDMPIFPYTVNEAADIQAMFDAGVDGVITDDPLLACEILRRNQAA